MKLIEDDGTVIEQFHDASALLIFHPGAEMSAFIPKMAGDVQVPENILLAGALLVFLRYRDNVDQVLQYLPKKNHSYKGN